MKTNRFKRSVSALLAFVLIVSLFTINVGALDKTKSNSVAWNEKISQKLWDVMDSSENSDKISAWIWFTDIDKEKADEKVKEETGLSLDNIEVNFSAASDDLIDALDEASQNLGNNAKMNAASQKLSSYIDSTKNERAREKNKADKFVKERRKALSDLYDENNSGLIKKLKLNTGDVEFQSMLTPSVIANLTKKQICKAAKSANVESIDYYSESQANAPLCEAQQTTMNVTKAREQYGLTGSGVNVLMNDHGCVRSDADNYQLISNTDNIKAVVNGAIYPVTNTSVLPGSSSDTHPNFIAAEMQAFAPDVHIFSAGYGCYQDVEWALLNCDIQLINGSINIGSYDSYIYDSPAKWFDALVSTNNVTLIASAGNDEGWQAWGWPNVISPASGYNSIAAGAYYTNGVSEDDTMFNFRYNPTTGSDLVCYKPDMVIAANSTSEASPALSGIVSMLIELRPSLAAKPELIKAILMASCNRKVKPAAGTGEQEKMTDGLTQRQGSGAVDAYRAIQIVLQNNYGIGDVVSGLVEPCTIPVDGSRNVNVSIAWLRNNTDTSTTIGNTTLGDLQELELSVYNDSRLMGSSSKTNAGKQMVYFSSGNTSSQYTVNVRKTTNNATSVRYAYAWSTDGNSITLHTNDSFGTISKEEVTSQLNAAGISSTDTQTPLFVSFDESVRFIGDNAFDGCTSLTGVTFPQTLKEIGESAFNSCTMLKTVVIPNEVLTIEDKAFQNCSSINNITIGSSVRSIGDKAFYNCSSLSNVVFTKTIASSIGTQAFSGIAANATAQIPAGAIGYADYYDDLQVIHIRDMRTIYFTDNQNWGEIHVHMWKNGLSSHHNYAVMQYAYKNYYNQNVYSVTFDYNEYDAMTFFKEGGESTSEILVGADGTGYYLTSKNSDNFWQVSTFTPDVRTIYFTNNNNWSDVRAYLWKYGTNQNNSWHGFPMTYASTNSYGQKIYSITLDYSEFDSVVFNDNNSSEQTVDISIGESGIGYYLTGGKSGSKWQVNTYTYVQD